MMEISPEGLALIKSFEKFEPMPYQDSAGVFTIGYGETHGITKDTPAITEPEAVKWLWNELAPIEDAINHYITRPLNQNQFDALCSLCYNCGTALLKPSDKQPSIGDLLNSGKFLDAANTFLHYDHYHDANGELQLSQGLANRRSQERSLFLKPAIVANNGPTS